MSDKSTDESLPKRLVEIIPVVRGLLAEATVDPDMPYKPVIVKSLTGKKAIEFAGSAKNA